MITENHPNLTVKLYGDGRATVIYDGNDIADRCRSINIDLGDGRLPKVSVDLIVGTVDIESNPLVTHPDSDPSNG